MSWVTNAILCFGCEDTKFRLDEVNKLFEEDGVEGFVRADDPELPRGWYGGQKFLECDLAIGAFNYLSIEDLIEVIRLVDWENPEAVQLIIKDQEDYKFRIIDIFPEAQTAYEEEEYR